jgi:hypothetical protein
MIGDVVEGFEQSVFEDAVKAALAKRIGEEPDIIGVNLNYGVVPFIRLEGKKVDWQELAAALARQTGVGVTCIAHCDWSFADRPDEEATFVAFAVPGVSEDYRDDPYRNLIKAVDPTTAPSEEDFINLNRARRILGGHLQELSGRRESLIAAGRDEGDIVGRIEAIEKLKELTAGDRDAVRSVLELDFDAAVAVHEGELEPVSPRM